MQHFAVIGVDHPHGLQAAQGLQAAGGVLKAVCPCGAVSAQAAGAADLPQSSLDAILSDPTIGFVVIASPPSQRAALGRKAMAEGKDVLAVKPGFTSLPEIAAMRDIVATTGRKYLIWFSERLHSPSTLRAIDMASSGMVGDIVQVIAAGPHAIGVARRPPWFWRSETYAGLINDLCSHQVDQYLTLTQGETASVTHSAIRQTEKGFHYWGELSLTSASASFYGRADWLSPQGLRHWGDTRLTIIGSTGFIEVRKNIDLAGRTGSDHIFLSDAERTTYIAAGDTPLPFFARLLDDFHARSETALSQHHCFEVSRLALEAQHKAVVTTRDYQ